MKKQILALSVTALLGFIGIQQVMADSGTITLDGTIGDSTCAVSSADLNQHVALGNFTTAQITSHAAYKFVADAKQVDFHVSGCEQSKTTADVNVTYATDGRNYIVKNNGTAGGLLLSPVKRAMVVGEIPSASTDVLSTGEKSVAASLANGAGTVSFWIGAQRSGGTITAGTLSGTIAVSMDYN